MERVERNGESVAVARTNEDACAALSGQGVDCVDVVAPEGEPLTVDGDVASGKQLRVVSGDVFEAGAPSVDDLVPGGEWSSPGGASGVCVIRLSNNVSESSGARDGGGGCGNGVVGWVPVVDDGASAGDGIPVVEGGPLSQPRDVSREFIEAELERWRDLLERLGDG